MQTILSSQIFYYALVTLVGFLIGLAKGGLGGTSGALAVPLLTLTMTPAQANGMALPILMFADLFAVGAHWKRWEKRYVFLLLPGAIVGVTIGTFFIINVSPQALRRILGVIVLLFVLYKLLEQRILGAMTYQPRNWHGIGIGTVAGFASALAQNGGPPVTMYLLMQQVTPSVFIATSALFFFVLNWIKVPYYMYAHIFDLNRVWQIAFLLPVVPAGVYFGKWAAGKMDRTVFERVIVGLLGAVAILLLVR